MFRSLLTLMLFVLAVMATNPVMSGSTPEPSVSADDCRSAWNNAPAASSCTIIGGAWVTDNKCNFKASCKYMRSPQVEDRKQSTVNNVPEGDVGKVNNCSGTLTYGSC